MKEETPILVGNSFPLALVRRRVVIEPMGLEELRSLAQRRGVVSFWGHANTLAAASRELECDLAPSVERPALTLDADGFPALAGRSHRECYVLSPDYRPGFRPAIGVEVTPSELLGWSALKITWV